MQGLASPSAEPATVAAPPYPAPSAPPPLRPWSRTWRYLAALGIALVLWLAAGAEVVPADGTAVAGDVEARIGAALVLDALLGVLGLGALPLRRSHPRTAGVLTGLLTTVSASAIGAATVALVSVSTWRRWRLVVPVVAVWVAAAICYELVWRPSVFGESFGMGFIVLSGGLAVGVGATCVATGYYVGARRELLSTLQLRAETAEREQAAKAEAARQAERTRIAREMHDVLAHRISLVAMHAGALAYRTDLSREETAAAAGVIRDNAHRALTELREVLGVLRAGHGAGAGSREGDALAEPPQPVLEQVGELLDAARATVEVMLDATGLPGGSLAGAAGMPVTVSRTAYRVVQEALTNACKHAPGSAVVVRLAGGPGGLLTVEVHNDVPPAGSVATPAAPGAGLGLVGLAERVELAGGVLEHGPGSDGCFAVRVWLPWEEE